MDDRLDEQLNLIVEASVEMRRAGAGEDRVRAATQLRDAAAVAEWLARDEARATSADHDEHELLNEQPQGFLGEPPRFQGPGEGVMEERERLLRPAERLLGHPEPGD